MEIIFLFLMYYLAQVELKLYADDLLRREKPLVCIAISLFYSLEFHSIGWRLNHFISFYLFIVFFASGFTPPSVIFKALVFLYLVLVFTALSTLPLWLKTTYFPCQAPILPSKSTFFNVHVTWMSNLIKAVINVFFLWKNNGKLYNWSNLLISWWLMMRSIISAIQTEN